MLFAWKTTSLIKHPRHARTPQRNGVPERRNNIIKEVVRTVIADSNPMKYWAKAANTNASRQKHHIKYGQGEFQIHNNRKTKLKAFEGKTDDGIFLGCSTSSKAYRDFNFKTLTVEESLHFVFDESFLKLSKE